MYEYWFIVSVFYLCLMLVVQYNNWNKQKQEEIPAKYNYFMYGVTFSLTQFVTHNFFYILGMLFFIILLRVFVLKKVIEQTNMKELDSLSWILYGQMLIGFNAFLLFSILVVGISTLYKLLITLIQKKFPAIQLNVHFLVLLFCQIWIYLFLN